MRERGRERGRKGEREAYVHYIKWTNVSCAVVPRLAPKSTAVAVGTDPV